MRGRIIETFVWALRYPLNRWQGDTHADLVAFAPWAECSQPGSGAE